MKKQIKEFDNEGSNNPMIPKYDAVKKNIQKEIERPIDNIAIYGTGAGAEDVYKILSEMGLREKIRFVIDRDESIYDGMFFHAIKVCSLAECLNNDVQLIVVGARKNSGIITKRIDEMIWEKNQNVEYINPFEHHNYLECCNEYIEYIEKQVLKPQTNFLPFEEHDFNRTVEDTKLIAWYLPQFYEIDVNNKVHGKGFTEWSNSSRMIPLFKDHYQPHIPYDVGYYNLLNIDTWKRQIFLAKNYGIYGFGFHYYWFSGKRIMEKPVELFLKHKELDIPFLLNWATESWNSVWDGDNVEKDTLIFEQKLRDEDDELFMKDILPYFYDSRYIKIDGKPVLSIYRSDIFEETRFKELICNFRKIAKKNGFPDLFILLTTATKNLKSAKWHGVDAIVEYPPHKIARNMEKLIPTGYLNPYFVGSIFNAEKYIDEKAYMYEYGEDIVFRTAMTSYDNTPRRCIRASSIYWGITPEKYKEWLRNLIEDSINVHSENKRYVFINSWNEWAEGAHLEPDMKYGYSYLQATYEALIESRKATTGVQ